MNGQSATTVTDQKRRRIAGHPVLLYDGVCALCNGVVRWVLRHDREGIFLFAPLESAIAAEMLGTSVSTSDGVAVVTGAFTPDQRVLRRTDAVAEALRLLGWRRRARMLELTPKPLREFGYGIVARLRYRLFGRYAACPLPPVEERRRFLVQG